MNHPVKDIVRQSFPFNWLRIFKPCVAPLALIASLAILSSTSHAASMIRGMGGSADLGTLAMSPNDDGSTGKIPLGSGFPNGVNFFGTTYTDFYINNNGNITFRGPLYNYTPNPFPISSQPMIAPYWADVDTRAYMWSDPTKNKVYYSRVGNKIYISWNYVGYYSYNTGKLNAFQVILTDRSDIAIGDFDVEFRYEQLQWTTGDASGGWGGLGGTPAQMGFDAGDRANFYSHPDSQTAMILDLTNTSNINDPGVWRFEVRSGVVVPGPVAILKDVRVTSTISTIGIDLDHSTFSKIPDSVTTLSDSTVIEWRYATFAADNVDDFHFDVMLKNPQGGEQRLVSHKLELTYIDANGNPVRTEIGPRSVFVLASAFEAAIMTDKPAYGPNQNALIAATVKSLSEYTRTVDVKIAVEDAAGSVFSQEVYTGVTLAAGVIRNFTANFETGNSYAGDYRAHLLIYEGGKQVGKTTAPFQINPDINVTSSISTDKGSYNANEPVVLTSVVESATSNYILSDLNARITLTDPQRNQVFSDEKPIKTLLPLQTTQLSTYWNTGVISKGRYTVLLQIFDGYGTLSTSSAVFDIAGTASTGSGIAGTISAQPNPVQKGENETVDYSITNTGNEDVTDLPANILIADAKTLEVKQTIPIVISLPVSGRAGERITVSTDDLAPGTYLALLQIAPPASQPKTLARATFEVFIDLEPKLEILKKISEVGNVLVWLNYPWESGKNCPDRVLIERALREAGVIYRIVAEKKDFEKELRNPVYTDFVILGDHHPMEDHFSEELREQVNSGKGLVASMFSRTNLDGDLFGINRTGYLSGSNYALELLPSEISAGASLNSSGRAIRTEVLTSGDNVGWLIEETPNGNVRHPGAIVRQYGLGKVVFLTFDLGLTSSNYDPFALIFADSLRHVHSPPRDLLPGQPVPVEVTLRTFAGNLDLKMDEIFPPLVTIYDMKSGLELSNPWTTDLFLMLNEEKSILYNAALPGEKGTYTLISDIRYADGGMWKSYGTYSLDLVVEHNVYDLFEEVSFQIDMLSPTLSIDVKKVEAAKDILVQIPRYMDENQNDVEIQQTIHNLLKAVNAIHAMESVDIGEIRGNLDKLIIIFESRWYALQ